MWAAAPALPDPLPREDRTFGDGLFVDLIPTSCWFTNVRTCVSPPDWARVKALVGAPSIAARCAVPGPNHRTGCGCRHTNAGPTTIRPGYRPCGRWCPYPPAGHRTTHVGFAEVTGQDPQAHAHLRTVNGWSIADADAHIAMADRVWRARSAVDSSLDLSILTAAGVLPSPAPTPTGAGRRAIATGTLNPTIHDTPVRSMNMARTSTTKVTARERARAAKAVLDAERHDHEKAVEDATTTYYEAQDARDAAATALKDADTARGSAVQALLDLGEPPARVAALVGLTTTEVRKLKRTAATEENNSNENSEQEGEATDPSTGPAALAS